MKTTILTAAALLITVPLAARAEDVKPAMTSDGLSYTPATAGGAPQQAPDVDPYRRRYPDDPPPYGQARWQARQGLLLSLGVGGGSMYLSTEDARRTGALDLSGRIGYGFSDRFQMFIEFNSDLAHFNNTGDDVASWTATLRGQTVLIGDRSGNGLNLNFGVGLGGVTYNSNTFDEQQSETGLALAGGVSYSARIGKFVALEPEFFVNWHAIPNPPGFSEDVASTYGLRLNLVWYLH